MARLNQSMIQKAIKKDVMLSLDEDVMGNDLTSSLIDKKKLANGTGIYIIKKNSKILKIFKEILSSIDFKNKYRFKIIKIGSKDARVFNKENKKSKNI